MCPMLPISLLAILFMALIEVSSGSTLKLNFNPAEISIADGQTTNVSFWSSESANFSMLGDEVHCNVSTSSETTASVKNCYVSYGKSGRLEGHFELTGNLLGYAHAAVKLKSGSVDIEDKVRVAVVLRKTTVQHIFLGSIILLVSMNYVNMGCALDLAVIKETLKKPIGPVVGMLTQYGLMPTISYLSASYLLSEPYLKLGLFTFGCSPAGGASNMWTVLLGGNLDLSVTMTFLSTCASLGMMPLWLFTAGKTFFKKTSPRIPFRNIISGLLGMVISLGVGLIMQRFCPKGTAFCRRILAPFSVAMIVFIIIFGTYANLYMFKLITWEMTLAAVVNVWTGFAAGLVVARLTGLSWRDAVTVMVETGIQNTGVAIFLLEVSLPKPDGHMAAIIPMAGSLVTPIPLTCLWFILKLTDCCRQPRGHKVADREAVKFKLVDDTI